MTTTATHGRLRVLTGGERAPDVPAARPELGPLVRAARDGDQAAWTELVRRFQGRLRAVARSYGLCAADVEDVVQATWLQLLESITTVREPAAIAGWLVTTTRRTALRAAQRPVRERLSADPDLGDRAEHDGPERRLLGAERRDVVSRALNTLPERDRRLMVVLLAQPSPDYAEVSRVLGMPHGSIGPIRGRCLQRLQRHPELQALRHP